MNLHCLSLIVPFLPPFLLFEAESSVDQAGLKLPEILCLPRKGWDKHICHHAWLSS